METIIFDSHVYPKSLEQALSFLIYSDKVKSLKITNLSWQKYTTGNIGSTSTGLAAMMSQNYGLHEITIDGKPSPEDIEIILHGLRKNFSITKFTMPCTDEDKHLINIIMERNRQFLLAQRILLLQLHDELGAHSNVINEALARMQTDATSEQISEALFYAWRDSNSMSPDIAEKIQATIDTIKKLKRAGIEACTTAVHASVAMNRLDYLEALLQMGANINAQNERGETALMIATEESNASAINCLCKHGADKSILDNSGSTAHHIALQNRQFDIANQLDPYASASERQKYLLKRNLMLGFGVTIFDRLQTHHLNGGGKREGFAILAEYLTKFAESRNFHPKLTRIACHFQSGLDAIGLSTQEKLQKFNAEGVLHSMTGCISHLCGISIYKNDDNTCTMYMAERGLFAYRAKHLQVEHKRPSIQSLTFADELLPQILDKLEASRFEPMKSAEKLLFSDIPYLAKSTWEYDKNSLQSQLKRGICFIGNIKPLVQNEFKHYYGEIEGHELYKEFTLFLRNALLHDYAEFSGNDDPYKFIAEEKLTEKYSSSRLC